MKNTLCWMAAGLLLVAAAAALVLAAALQREPVVAGHEAIGPEDVRRTITLLRRHDPRYARPGRTRTVVLGERDLEVLIDLGTSHWPDAASRVSLQSGAATVTISARAPPNPFGGWINLEARLVQGSTRPVVAALHVGDLPVPVWLGEWAALRLAARAGRQREVELVTEVVQRVRFMPQRLQVAYAWRDDSARRVMETMLPAADQDRLRRYAERVAALGAAVEPGADLPLAQLLGPVFALARERSAVGGDAAAENRAAIVALALYANGRGFDPLPPGARTRPQAPPPRLLLSGRDDFPRHFLVSAALAVEATGALAQSIGLAKEVADARAGSGFSFNDMAANLAGTRFGEMALRAPAELQARVAGGVSDGDLMPAWADLPEFMPEDEFLLRYGGVGAPPYETLMAEIDRRVAALRLFR